MSIRMTTHCDRDGCDTHVASGLAEAAGFLAVEWHGQFLDYCSVDCLLVGMARYPGLTTVEERP